MIDGWFNMFGLNPVLLQWYEKLLAISLVMQEFNIIY